MTVSVDELFGFIKTPYKGPVIWGESFDATYSGVYILALTDDPFDKSQNNLPLTLDRDAFNNWVLEATNLQINEKPVTCIDEAHSHLNNFWHANENILYIGESSSKTKSIYKRVKQFYSHKVGKQGPHTGGYWLKLLSELPRVNVYYAQTDNPREIEFKLLMKFAELKANKSIFDMANIAINLPFANLKVDILKQHTIAKPTNKYT